MAGLKVWNGSQFVDGVPRIWNGSAFVAPSECHIWNGSAFVKVWPSFTRQRMVKSGTFTRPSNQSGTVQVTGWESDGTYPSTVTSHALVVQGAGDATIAWNLTGSLGTISVRLNGDQISASRTGSVSGTVEEGDQITVFLTSNFQAATVTAGAYIEVIPT